MIPVTKPFTPPIEEYQELVSGVFDRGWFTNAGPLLSQLELSLKDYLGVPHLLFTSNGTLAIQLAIKALGIKGEIITTPFSYAATTTSIVWEGCKPVFADICRKTFNLDPKEIVKKISKDTSAILATHVYGNPCDVQTIENIANEHGLKVIYDGAHAFGVTVNGKSIFNYGDVSTCSYHATKLFHTVEGGSIVSNSPELIKSIARMRSFGHTTPYTFDNVGTNAKNSELHAAMGLCNLKYINNILQNRKTQYEMYKELLNDSVLTFQEIRKNTNYNFAYFPCLFPSEAKLLKCEAELNDHQVFPRRYFNPSLNTLKYVAQSSCPVSEDISSRVLCLPMYHDLSVEEQILITRIVKRSLKYEL